MACNLLNIASVLSLLLVSMATADEDFELDRDRPHMCTRYTYRLEMTYQNVSVRCFTTEWDRAPCRDSYSYYYPWRRHHYRRRYHHYWTRDTSHVTNTTSSPVESPGADSNTTTDVAYDQSDRCCRRVESSCWEVRLTLERTRTVEPYCCHGYEPDGTGGCFGSIECSEDNGGCDHMCYSDDDNGHHCGCFNGYESVDRKDCLDIDECAVDNGGCSHGCENTFGGYYCTCPPGYNLASPTECQDVNECLLSNGGCDQLCQNTDGAFFCQCDDGFYLKDGYMCQDIDECAQPNNGGCSDGCNNDFGDFECTCPEGWSLEIVEDEDGFQCLLDDIEEPAEPSALPSTLAELFQQPVAVGSMIGVSVFLLLLMIAIVLCVCCCRKRKQPPAKAPTIFAVSKGKMADIEGGAASLGSILPTEKCDKQNAYVISRDVSRSSARDLPTYDEAVKSRPDVSDMTESDKAYMKPGVDPDSNSNVYTNPAYTADNSDSNAAPGERSGSG